MKTTVTWAMVAVLAGLSTGGWAQNAAEASDTSPGQIGVKIDEVDSKIADLERQKEALQLQKQQAELREEPREKLEELRTKSRERISEAEERLAEIEKEDAPETPATRALVEGRRKFLGDRNALDRKLLAIGGDTALELTEQMGVEIDNLETEWRLVLEPRLDSAATLENLEEDLAKEDSAQKRAILEKLKQLAQKDAEGRPQEFALAKAREERERTWDKLVHEFSDAR
jgi:hypothetical protein